MSKYRQPNKKSFQLFYDNIEPVIENFSDECKCQYINAHFLSNNYAHFL